MCKCGKTHNTVEKVRTEQDYNNDIHREQDYKNLAVLFKQRDALVVLRDNGLTGIKWDGTWYDFVNEALKDVNKEIASAMPKN